MHRFQYYELPLDRQLAAADLRTLDRMVEETQSKVLRSFRDTLAELNQDARRRGVGVGALVMASTANLALCIP